MFGSIVTLIVILVITYLLDFQRISRATMRQKVTYTVIFGLGFTFIACYAFNRNLPSVLSLIHPNV